MTKYIVGCFISLLLISPTAFGDDGTGGYLEGGPSEAFESPTLDLQRSYYGTFEKEQESKPVRGRTREAKPLTESAIKEVPTFAEVEAAKVKATQHIGRVDHQVPEHAHAEKGLLFVIRQAHLGPARGACLRPFRNVINQPLPLLGRRSRRAVQGLHRVAHGNVHETLAAELAVALVGVAFD